MNWIPRRALVRAAASAVLTLCAHLPAQGAVDVVELTVQDIELGLAEGDFSIVELVKSYLARTDVYEPYYNAFTNLNPDALADAAALDVEYQTMGPRSPLHGVPVLVKDSMNVADMPTTGGYGGFVAPVEGGFGIYLLPESDSPAVARLRDAGAVILGKTNMPPFGRSASSADGSFYGSSFNTYDRTVIAGGSSTGSAVGVSLSFGAVGIGEESSGSIQNPAGANCLVGVKTSFGLVPTSGAIPLRASKLDVFGPIARSVDDAAVTLDAIAGYDASDPRTAASIGQLPEEGYAAGLTDLALQGRRIGLWGPGWSEEMLTPETAALYDAAVDILEAEGAILVESPFENSTIAPLSVFGFSGDPRPYDLNQFFASLGAGMPSTFAEFQVMTGIDLFQPRGPLVGNITTQLAAALMDPSVLPDLTVFTTGRAMMLAEFRAVLDEFDLDAFFFPQMWAPLEPRGFQGSYNATTEPEINKLGTPAVNLCGGFYSDGTPFSVQFLGDMWSEDILLALAYDFEKASMFRVAPTPVPEPTKTMLMGVAVGVLVVCRRRAASRGRP